MTLTANGVMRPGRSVDKILVGVGVLVLLGLCLMAVPIGVLLLSSFKEGALLGDGQFSLANFQQIWNHPLFGQTARNTLIVGVGTVAVMLLFALPCAWLYTRTDLPRKDLLVALLTIKIAVPGFLVAMGYIFLFNPSNGIGNQLARQLFGIEGAVFNVYTLGWIIWLQGAALASPAFFMLVPTLRAIDAALEEAAWVSGVRKYVTALRIIVPLAAPAILATGVYYFIIAIEMFDYAGMLGLPARKYVLATWLYQIIYADSLPEYGQAAALGVLAAIGTTILAGGYIWSTRQAARYAVVTGKRRAHRDTRLGRRGKLLAWLFILAFVSFALLVPLALLVWSSLLPFLQMPSLQAFSQITLAGYREAFILLPPLLANNLVVMLAVPTISVVLAACIAWVSTRTRMPGRQALDVTVMVSVAVPSIVTALGFFYFGILTFHLVPLYTTIWIIVLAMATRSLTWANRTIGSTMTQIHPEIDEVCITSGVKRGRAFVSVILPTVKHALLFSWFWVAMLSLRELTIPIMLEREDTRVIATAIWGLNQAGSSSTASALGVILVCLIFVVVFIFHRVAGQRAI